MWRLSTDVGHVCSSLAWESLATSSRQYYDTWAFAASMMRHGVAVCGSLQDVCVQVEILLEEDSMVERRAHTELTFAERVKRCVRSSV